MCAPRLFHASLGSRNRPHKAASEPSHGSLRANIKKNAKHGHEEDWLLEQSEAGTDAGRYVGLGLPNLEHRYARRPSAIKAEERGNPPAIPCSRKMISPMAACRYVAAVLPMPLIPGRSADFDCSFLRHSLSHDRIAGHLEECRSYSQHENAFKRMRKSGWMNDGMNSAAAFNPNPRSNKFFFPIRAARIRRER